MLTSLHLFSNLHLPFIIRTFVLYFTKYSEKNLYFLQNKLKYSIELWLILTRYDKKGHLMNCVLYVRVSTDEQAREGFSIAAQKERLKAFALSQGWDIVGEYTEEGWSAKNTDRPQLKKLMKDIEKGNIDIVLVYRLDRLTRSVLDLYKLLKIFDDNDTAFKSATEVYDTSTAMGRLFITLVAALAQWERENLSERVKFGVSQMLDEGKRPGTTSNYGYKFDKDFNCTIIEEEANVIRMMFKWYLDGYGYVSIANMLNERGYEKPKRANKWGGEVVKKCLTNPIYVGHYKWGDRNFKNNHISIVDELTFQKAQLIRNDRTPKTSRLGKFSLTGILRCGECDHRMIGTERRYRCDKCNRTVVEYKVIDILLDELEKLINDKEYFTSRLDEIGEDQTNFDAIQLELDKISKQKNKLLDLYTDENSPFDKSELYEKIKKLNEQEQALKIKIGELNFDNESPSEKHAKIKNLKDVRTQFSKADLHLQKQLINSVFDTVYFYKIKYKDRKNVVRLDYLLK